MKNIRPNSNDEMYSEDIYETRFAPKAPKNTGHPDEYTISTKEPQHDRP